jgi:hypothetical protein
MAQATRVRQIFISYVEEDADIALEIAQGLEEAGYTTWYYERDSLPGLSYLVQVREAIEQARAVVLIISPDSLGSKQVTSEIVRSHECDKPFVPLLHNITHTEFQQRQPEWQQALGAATSIQIPQEGAHVIVPRLVAGLKALGIQPDPKSTRTEAKQKHLEQLYARARRAEAETDKDLVHTELFPEMCGEILDVLHQVSKDLAQAIGLFQQMLDIDKDYDYKEHLTRAG